jgi:ABC-type nitrate/sulfonate/bicarbonate transport system substrate-binding protein
MDRIKIGIGVSSIGRFLPWIGAAAGLFDKMNIAVDVVNQQDEEKVVDDIVTQTTPVGTPNAPSLIFSRLAGNDLVIVGGILNRPAFYLAANAKIGSTGALRAKKIGINQPRRMAGLMMRAMLRRWQLDGAGDLELVDFGVNDVSLEALRAGTVDAALLPPEKAFLAEAEGFRIVADSLGLQCHWVPLATTRRFLAAHRELVAKVASIYRESARLFKSEPGMALEVIGRHLPALAGQPQVLEKCYGVFAELFEPTLTVDASSLNAILDEVALQDPEAKELDRAALVENIF